MRVFLAGASGVMGMRMIPLLVADGHVVAGMTRTESNVEMLSTLGAGPVVCDVLERDAVHAAIDSFGPEVVVNQLTDLPDDPKQIPDHAAAHARVRTEGTENLVAAATHAGASRFIVQSVAWELHPMAADAVARMENTVLGVGGVVLRYGQWYGPGTYYEATLPPHPRVHVDEAARRTVAMLEADPGTYVIVDE